MKTITELLLLHHTHTDLGYTHPQPVVWELHSRYLDEAFDLCERTADWPEACRMKWTCEVTCTFLHWLERASARQTDRLRALVRNGQIGFGAMWAHWMLPLPWDLFVESLQPVRRIRDEFGAPVSVAVQHDVNGIPWSAVDILNDAGIPNLLMGINLHMGGSPLRRPMAFRWAGPGGRTLLAFNGEHYNTFSRAAELRAAAGDLDRSERGLQRYFTLLTEKGWDHDFAFLTATHPFMDDNGPANPELPAFVRLWNAEGRSPHIRLVTPEQLFEKLRALPDSGLPVHRGDWTDFWTTGSGSLALETAMMRRAHAAWASARTLADCAGVKLNPRSDKEALRHILAAYEHTANAFCSTAALGPSRRIEPFPIAEQWNQKAATCASALSWARLLRRDVLDAVADNPVQARQAAGMIAFNPSHLSRLVCLRVPRDLLAGQDALIGGTKHRLDVVEDLLGDRTSDWVGPIEVPPCGSTRLNFKDLARAQVADGVRVRPGTVESPHFVLSYDVESGRIMSLRHVATKQECVDAGCDWEFFGPVRETVAAASFEAQAAGDLRYDLFQVTEETFQSVHDDVCLWNREWPARHDKATAGRVTARTDAEGAHLTRTFRLAGIEGELEQTITLFAHEPRVRFEAYFNKGNVTEPEALYFTFPFQMPQAQLFFDSGGEATAFDADQLPGACRDWLATGDWLALAGAKGCVVIACPDAPLWQVGGFNYGRGIKSSVGLNQALLLAWPMNNYWNTNFRAAQPGFIRLRWELACFETFETTACADFGASSARQVVWHPLNSSLPRMDG
jgi:alpha-mannosidase